MRLASKIVKRAALISLVGALAACGPRAADSCQTPSTCWLEQHDLFCTHATCDSPRGLMRCSRSEIAPMWQLYNCTDCSQRSDFVEGTITRCTSAN